MAGYRSQNNQGYKKIYPMSLYSDETFCHYCGRTVTANLGLHWDHVPALNVKIPEEYGIEHELKKTLIRSCSECNLLASDIPHLDYLERHLWLKVRYLRRYKSVLEKGTLKFATNRDDSVTNIYSGSAPNLSLLLTMLGFGLADIDLIKSPILEIKNIESKRKIRFLLLEHLTGIPIEDTNDESDDEYKEFVFHEAEDINLFIPTTDFLIELIVPELSVGKCIYDDDSLIEWICNHPGRSAALELDAEAVALYEIDWSEINNLVNNTKGEFDSSEDDNEGHLVIENRLNSSELDALYSLESIITNLKDEAREFTLEDYRVFIKENCFSTRRYNQFLLHMEGHPLLSFITPFSFELKMQKNGREKYHFLRF